MREPPPLRELQLRLRSLIFRHKDASPAAIEQAAAALPIAGDERLSAAERLAIYAGMHFARIRDVLAEDFPATRRAAAGEFDSLVGAYLDAHPTDDPSLRRAGRHIGAFLSRHPEWIRFAWQPELARLEWEMIESFDAADDATLRPETLASLRPDDWPGLRLRPVASLRRLSFHYPVDRIRERLLAGDGPRPADPERVQLRVWRQDFTVYLRRLDRTETLALEALERGGTFADLCERVAEDERARDEPASAVLELLRLWLADEILASPRVVDGGGGEA